MADIETLQQNIDELSSKLDEVEKSIKKRTETIDRQIELLNEVNLLFPLTINNKKAIFNELVFPVTITLQGSAAATADNYDVFFIADRDYLVVSISEIHSTVGSDGSDVTCQVQKLTGTEAVASGSDILSTAFDLKGTANTVQEGILVLTSNTLVLNKGDRLALDDSGTLTAVTDVIVTVQLRII